MLFHLEAHQENVASMNKCGVKQSLAAKDGG